MRIRLLLLASVGLLLACPQKSARKPTPEYDRILRLAHDRRRVAMVALGPRERIALYLEAVELYHPPMIWIADEVADVDSTMQEHVAAVLDSSTSETQRSDLFYLAYVVFCRDTARVRSGSLNAAIERSAGSVRSTQAKRYLDAARRARAGDCSG